MGVLSRERRNAFSGVTAKREAIRIYLAILQCRPDVLSVVVVGRKPQSLLRAKTMRR
jgi:hypothetical protein